MEYVLTNDQMRFADKYTIETLKIPSLELMERAGRAVADKVVSLNVDKTKILCVCGGGNNGGDGFVSSSILLEKGYNIEVLCIAERLSEACEYNKNRYIKLGGIIHKSLPKTEYSVIIDCLFGTGLSRNIEGRELSIIEYINNSKAVKISVDIPSGLSGNSGLICGNSVRADQTICIGEYKTGLFLNDGLDCSYTVDKVDIGIKLPELKDDSYAFLLDDNYISSIVKKRKRNSNKGTYGKCAIIAGSKEYTGAALLSAKSALRSGAGYVSLFIPGNLFPLYALKLPEILIGFTNDGDRYKFDENKMERLLSYSSIVIGMGMGISEDVFKAVIYLIKNFQGKLIIDADGINSLSKYGKYILNDIFNEKKCDIIITPHIKEFSRLTGFTIDEILKDSIRIAKSISKKYGIKILLKNATTIITDENNIAINIKGNSGQAKGGSGDVLSGIIGSLCATGVDVYKSGCVGAYIAGSAAEYAKEEYGEYSMTPSDEIEYIGKVLKGLIGN